MYELGVIFAVKSVIQNVYLQRYLCGIHICISLAASIYTPVGVGPTSLVLNTVDNTIEGVISTAELVVEVELEVCVGVAVTVTTDTDEDTATLAAGD